MSESVFNKAKDLGGRGFHTGSSTLGEFKEFILRGNVVSLAVAVIIGTAFNTVIQAFVKDIITPLIPAGNQNFADYTITIYGGGKLLVGDLLNVIISFLIIAAVVFFLVVKPFNALEAAYEGRKPKHEAAPTTRECPYCLSTVPLQASRCAFCTSPMPPAINTVPQPVV